MADKFVAKRTDIASSGAVSGDVIYLMDQNEVYDVVNTKLTLVPSNAVKISSGVWAVRNAEKTLSYSLTKPPVYDSTKKIAKGTLVAKDGDIFISNDEIAANTAWATGTTGATWKRLSGSNVFTRDKNSSSSTSGGGGSSLWFSKTDIIGVAGTLSKILTSSYSKDKVIVVGRPSATTQPDAFKVGASWTIKASMAWPAGTTSKAVSITVASGDYIGIWHSSTNNDTNMLPGAQETGSNLCLIRTTNAPSVSDSFTVNSIYGHMYLPGLGWEITT